MRLGNIEVHLIGDGTFRLDGGAMFGVIPRPLWEEISAGRPQPNPSRDEYSFASLRREKYFGRNRRRRQME